MSRVRGAVPARPVPVPDARSLGFWEAATAHRLVVQRCKECGWLSHPPDAVCANCLSTTGAFEWHEVSGHGTLRTWTVVRTAFLPGFAPYVPYVVASVELDEQPGLRLVARLVTDGNDGLSAGERVEIDFDDSAGVPSVPVFRVSPR